MTTRFWKKSFVIEIIISLWILLNVYTWFIVSISESNLFMPRFPLAQKIIVNSHNFIIQYFHKPRIFEENEKEFK